MGTTTLPHEREKILLEDIIDDCVKGRNKLVVVVCDQSERTHYFIREAKQIAEESKDNFRIDISRDYLTFDSGSKIIFTNYQYGHRDLRGIKPDRIVIMGMWSEFWYQAMSSGATIEAVA